MTSSATMSSLLLVGARAPSPPACPPSTSPYKLDRRSIALRRGSQLSCKATSSSGGDLNLDRRDVLAALMGITAGGLNPNLAVAAADVQACKGNDVTDRLLHCNPSRGDGSVTSSLFAPPCPRPTVVDFKLPRGAAMRVRKPAHLADRELVEKYRLAVKLMKALPESDPRSFVSQARIHEAYCDAHYKLSTTTSGGGGTDAEEAPFDVHFSWIFAPWHRMYIYFYERILGSLIGDDTFALPYWNWDAPAGMVLPAMFREGDAKTNSLYDANRNMDHVDNYVVLDYVKDVFVDNPKKQIRFDPNNPHAMNEIVKDNLSLIHHQMIRGGKGARCFHGEKFCTEDEPGLKNGTSGTLDRMAHSGVHIFLGDNSKCYQEREDGCGMDMGFLGTAAFDPVFYTHHANVDRMWHLWAHELPGHRDFDDQKWLDTSFVFYDDRSVPVRIRVRDVLEAGALGYRFEEREPMLWKKSRPMLRRQRTKQPGGGTRSLAAAPPPEFPLRLKKGQSVVALVLDAPAKTKDKPVSLLFKNSIQFNPRQACKFDVAVNVPLDQAGDVGPQWVEYAGTFFTLQRSHHPSSARTSLELPLEDVLDDIVPAVKEGDPIHVVLVPRTDGVTILEKPTVVPTVCDEDYPHPKPDTNQDNKA